MRASTLQLLLLAVAATMSVTLGGVAAESGSPAGSGGGSGSGSGSVPTTPKPTSGDSSGSGSGGSTKSPTIPRTPEPGATFPPFPAGTTAPPGVVPGAPIPAGFVVPTDDGSFDDDSGKRTPPPGATLAPTLSRRGKPPVFLNDTRGLDGCTDAQKQAFRQCMDARNDAIVKAQTTLRLRLAMDGNNTQAKIDDLKAFFCNSVPAAVQATAQCVQPCKDGDDLLGRGEFENLCSGKLDGTRSFGIPGQVPEANALPLGTLIARIGCPRNYSCNATMTDAVNTQLATLTTQASVVPSAATFVASSVVGLVGAVVALVVA